MSEIPTQNQSENVETTSQEKPVGFNGLADRIVDRVASEDLTPLVQADSVNSLFDQVEMMSIEGRLKGGEGKSYSQDDMVAQFGDLVKLMNNPDGEEDFMKRVLQYVPRAEGLRDAIGVLLTNESTSSTTAKVLTERYSPKLPETSMEIGELDNETIVDDLSKLALKNTVEVKAETSFDILPESVKNEILTLQTAIGNKRMSERMQDYSQAGIDAGVIFRLKEELSDQAKKYLGY